MTSPGAAKILVCAAHAGPLAELRRLLDGHGYAVDGHLLGTPDPDGLRGFRLVILDGSGQIQEALGLCRRLRPRLEETFVPILFVTDDGSPPTRLAGFESGADTI